MRFRSQRLPSDTNLWVACGEEVFGARLANVSATGARLECARQLPPDTFVTLQFLYERIPARVVWSNARQTGIHFVTPLLEGNVTALRGAIGRYSSWGLQGHGFRELS